MTKVVFIGEAWGKDEEAYEHAFVGAAGQELYRMLVQASFPGTNLPYHFVSPHRMMKLWRPFPYPLLNVFNCRPPDPEGLNNAEFFYEKRITSGAKFPIDETLPVRKFGCANKWVKVQYAQHVRDLHTNLVHLKPNLIVALGATALWALGLPASVGKLRGAVTQSAYGKVLPVYHPAAVLRNWSLRVVSLIDFVKALREMEFPEIRTPSRYIWTKPTIPDLYRWWEEYGNKSKLIAVDIETIKKRQISEVGFASDPHHALHIPFVIEQRKGNTRTYQQWWKSATDEKAAWAFVRMVCESDTPKIGQNFIQYDLYWMLKELGIKVRNIQDDTMTKAHCWQPELDKNLGFLGSIFLDERSWKSIRADVGKDND